MFNVSQNMTNDENIHGLTKKDSTTTMMQNSQRGAVTYLVQSEYGNMKGTDEESGIWNNSYNEGITFKADGSYGCSSFNIDLTGMSGETRDDNTFFYSKAKKKTDEGDSIEVEYVKMNSDGTKENGYTATEGEKYTKRYWKYYTAEGQKASTTRNIYGIYDISGGSWECMASYLENATTNEYVNQLKNIDKRYQTGYTGDGSSITPTDKQDNYNNNKEKYGDSVWEISHYIGGEAAWNASNVSYPSFEKPFFKFGGISGSKTGVFSFNETNNGSGAIETFRVVLI